MNDALTTPLVHSSNHGHTPVMLSEVMQYLSPVAGGIYVDCTFGAGGYSKAILKNKEVKLYAIDCDPDVKPYVKKLQKELDNNHLYFIEGNFGDIESLLNANDVKEVTGIVIDLGVSSMQLDQASRGFSFAKNAKLDMRMNKQGYSAYDFINNADEEEIANIIYKYGDEHNSRRIASNICKERQKAPIETTIKLAEIVRSSFTKYRGKIDLATKTFQAIRIFINNELENLKKALLASEKLLVKGGKLVVVSFHSLEDSIVKNFIKERAQKSSSKSRYSIDISTTNDDGIDSQVTFKILTKKAIKPSKDEIRSNPRSRSARLRVAEKI